MIDKITSRFVATDGTQYGIEITYPQEGFEPREMEVLLSSEPITISYESEDKLSPLVQSRATLELFCEQDGAFRHLYSLAGRDVRLEVFELQEHQRWVFPDDDYSAPPVLHTELVRVRTIWRGTIDPEAYEEPYHRLDGYRVRLGFSDIGILRRRRHTLGRGLRQIGDIIRLLLAEAQFRIETEERNDFTDEVYIEEHYLTAPEVDIQCSTYMDGVESGFEVTNKGYIDTALFFDSEGEPIPCYDALEMLLRPLRLRLEQRGGVYYVYDHNTLSRSGGELTKSRGEDALLMADKVYNNVELTTSPRLDATTTELKPQELTGDFTAVPRTEIDRFTAYEVRTKPLEGGAYAIETKPATTGEALKAFALFYDPRQTQGFFVKYTTPPIGVSNLGTIKERAFYRVFLDMDGAFVAQNYQGDTMNPRHAQGETARLIPAFAQRLQAYADGVGSAADPDTLRSIFSEQREYIPLATLELSLPKGVRPEDYVLDLGAELLIGIGTSLYQELEAEHIKTTTDDPQERQEGLEKRRKALELERAEVFVLIEALRADGRRVSKIVEYGKWGKHHHYTWSSEGDRKQPKPIALQFGGIDGLSYNSWHKVRPHRHEVIEEGDGAGRREVETMQRVRQAARGAIFPLPSKASRAERVRVTLLTGVRLKIAHKDHIKGDSDTHTRDGIIPRGSRPYQQALEMGIIAPNYVLLRDLSLSLGRKDGRRLREEDERINAYILRDAYEPLAQELALSTSGNIEQFSPALLRRADGSPYLGDLVSRGAVDVVGGIAELYATSVVAAYGSRGYIIEGTYRPRLHPWAVRYREQRYMVLREEINLRDNKSRLTMVTLRPDERKPTYYTPKSKKP